MTTPTQLSWLSDAVRFVRRYALLILAVLLVLFLSIGYALGYRTGPGLTLVRTGTLTLTDLPVGATVYADQTRRGVAVGSSFSMALVPGNHMVIIDANGDFPWNEVVTISPHQSTSIDPILIPKHIVRGTVPEKLQSIAVAHLKIAKLPTDAAPLLAYGGCVALTVSNNRIIAQVASSSADTASSTPATCATPPAFLCLSGTCAPTVVFSPTLPLNSVSLVPTRQDALVVSYGDIVSVLEIDPRSPQFFAPILHLDSPVTLADWGWDPSVLVAREDNQYYTVSLGAPHASTTIPQEVPTLPATTTASGH